MSRCQVRSNFKAPVLAPGVDVDGAGDQLDAAWRQRTNTGRDIQPHGRAVTKPQRDTRLLAGFDPLADANAVVAMKGRAVPLGQRTGYPLRTAIDVFDHGDRSAERRGGSFDDGSLSDQQKQRGGGRGDRRREHDTPPGDAPAGCRLPLPTHRRSHTRRPCRRHRGTGPGEAQQARRRVIVGVSVGRRPMASFTIPPPRAALSPRAGASRLSRTRTRHERPRARG